MKKRLYTITMVWVVLVALTFVSIMIEMEIPIASLAASLVVLIALFKARLIFIYFMELSWGLKPYRHWFEVWAALAVCIIVGGYWYSVLKA